LVYLRAPVLANRSARADVFKLVLKVAPIPAELAQARKYESNPRDQSDHAARNDGR
jgi:hypothetical protein